MSAFIVGLSGIRAASTDLSVTGNNIANASTSGFKQSRAEFGDIYSNSFFGSAIDRPGSGVNVQAIAQQFAQGNIAGTSNVLDMAISGEGFFVVEQGGEQMFTRSGNFGLDDEGYVVTKNNARLQGFGVDTNQNVDGVLGDIRIDVSQQAPKQTTDVESSLNLDSNEQVIRRVGKKFNTDGGAIGVAQIDIKSPTTTHVNSSSVAFPAGGFDFGANSVTFDVNLQNAASGRNGTVSISLNSANGVPQNINNFNDARALVNVINAQLSSPPSPNSPIDIQAVAVDDGGGNFHIEFNALKEGEPSIITLSNFNNAGTIGLTPTPPATTLTDNSGKGAVGNGYPAQSIDIKGPDGNTATFTTKENATAAQTASELNALNGVTAKAETTATILGGADFINANGNLEITLNGSVLTGNDLPSLQAQINNLSNTALPGISATIENGNLQIRSSLGDDIRLSMSSTDANDQIRVQGTPAAPAQTLVQGGNAASNAIVIGGTIDIQLQDGFEVSNLQPPSLGLFQPFNPTSFEDVVLNPFNPDDPTTYNHTTSVKIYDSLGNSHIMNQYFIKQKYEPGVAGSAQNHWKMVVRIDGKDVGDPNPALLPPENTQPTVAEFDLYFNENGEYNNSTSDTILISNWTPRDKNGNALGTLGPQNVLQGGVAPVPEPPTSSNFTINMTGTTQHGTKFSVDGVDQNGYSTGRLTGISIDADGLIFARFSNQQSTVLGQVALANFTNTQGLEPSGDTTWVETANSGTPVIGSPRTAALGSVVASSLEDSNVDLSAELVDLIIAQRNYQANAKTIETSNQVTQTIINLR